MNSWTLWGLGFPLTGTGSGSGVLTILLKQPAKFLFLHSLYTPNQTKKKKKNPLYSFFAGMNCPKKFKNFKTSTPKPRDSP